MGYSYEEFKDVILSKLSEYYSGDTNIFFKDVLKNNGVRLDGLTIAYDAEERVNPVIYINDLYYKYCDDELSMDEVIAQIIEIRDRSDANSTLREAVSYITDWDTVFQHVYPILINTQANQEMLQDLVSRQFLDLSVAYIIRIPGDAHDMNATCKITKGMLKNYGISEEELYKQAINNMRDKEPFTVQSIYEIIGKFINPECPILTDDKPNMLVLSNGLDNYGAAQLLNISRLKEEYGSRSFYVITSSVHEAILVDYDDGADYNQLNQMVREVNESELAASDVLSDHVYFYNGATCELEMCA